MIFNNFKKSISVAIALILSLSPFNANPCQAHELKNNKNSFFYSNNLNTTGSSISFIFTKPTSKFDYLSPNYYSIPYRVQAYDSLIKISEKFNTSIESLKFINCISYNTLFMGQPLLTILPKPNYSRIDFSKTDPNLILVNKIFTLDGSYKPLDLVVPNVKFPFPEFHTKKLMEKEAANALENLFSAAKLVNHHLYALSGYRSYETQKNIFNRNVWLKGYEQANKFSAVPGQSEHQTGLAMDITSLTVNYQLIQRFGDTPEGTWVAANAHEYGFIIRYLKNKASITGYEYEPWHLRYVGVDIATEIKNAELTLEEYLIYPLKESGILIDLTSDK